MDRNLQRKRRQLLKLKRKGKTDPAALAKYERKKQGYEALVSQKRQEAQARREAYRQALAAFHAAVSAIFFCHSL